MRTRNAARLAARLAVLALLLPAVAAGCKKEAAPAAEAPPPVGGAAPAPAATPATIDIGAVASKAGLDEATRQRVAPHIEAMNQERSRMQALTGEVSASTPDSARQRIHKELSAHFAAFDKHWTEATAVVPAAQKQAFDAAIREQMGSAPRNVGNPHSKLPSTHPQLDSTGSAAKKK